MVVSITSFETATKAFNVIPQKVHLKGTVRTMDAGIRDLTEKRLTEIAELTAQAYGAVARVTYDRNYPIMVNADVETGFAIEAAKKVAGDCADAPLIMGGEDFAFMLNSRPGAYILVGNGDTAMVHHPEYEFNDQAIPAGCSWWVEMAEGRLPAG